MEKRTYPKLNILDLSKYIAELCLASEGSVSWIKEKKVIVVWHTIFLTTLSFLVLIFISRQIFGEIIHSSVTITYYYRLSFICFFCILLIMFAVLMYRYYRYLLLTSVDLRFQSIVLFASMFCVIFAQIYIGLYYLEPNLFTYSNPILVPDPQLMEGKAINRYLMFGEFILYSAANATNIVYPRIASASPLVSFINIVQSIISLILIALVISTFVQKSGQKPADDS